VDQNVKAQWKEPFHLRWEKSEKDARPSGGAKKDLGTISIALGPEP
jgi:hypothetical protein